MEYVCKVGTPAGEVVERTFVAPNEAALRAELEQQGFYLFALRRGLGLGGLTLRKPRVDPAACWSSARSWRRCSRPACRCYQSLDVMLERQRDPVFRRSLWRCATR